MKSLWNSLIVAFSMYSKIPMPRADWTKDNMKYSMCFFPWVGLAIGALEYGWFTLAVWLELGKLLRTAVLVILPVLVTGGIHLDGLLDTSDAMSSWRERERRLEILKDSHAGAFAVIIGICYFVLCFGAAGEVTQETLPVLCLGFGLSRTFSALSVENFPNANPKGTAATFGSNSLKGRVNATMAVYLTIFCAVGVLLNPLQGILLMAAAALTFAYYHHMALKYFGGITGDLAGFYVSLAELMMLLTVTVGNRVAGIIG